MPCCGEPRARTRGSEVPPRALPACCADPHLSFPILPPSLPSARPRQALCAAAPEERGGDADAEEVRACRAVPPLEPPALPLRGLPLALLDARRAGRRQLPLHDERPHAAAQGEWQGAWPCRTRVHACAAPYDAAASADVRPPLSPHFSPSPRAAQVCNHPDLFEARPIASPLALAPLLLRLPGTAVDPRCLGPFGGFAGGAAGGTALALRASSSGAARAGRACAPAADADALARAVAAAEPGAAMDAE